MDKYTDIERGSRILPGVDLSLWLQIIVVVFFLAAAVGIGFIAA